MCALLCLEICLILRVLLLAQRVVVSGCYFIQAERISFHYSGSRRQTLASRRISPTMQSAIYNILPVIVVVSTQWTCTYMCVCVCVCVEVMMDWAFCELGYALVCV